MRKVILGMTMTFDGFLAGETGELSWLSPGSDSEYTKDLVTEIESLDVGFIGCPTASVMVPCWQKAAHDPSASSQIQQQQERQTTCTKSSFLS